MFFDCFGLFGIVLVFGDFGVGVLYDLVYRMF